MSLVRAADEWRLAGDTIPTVDRDGAAGRKNDPAKLASG